MNLGQPIPPCIILLHFDTVGAIVKMEFCHSPHIGKAATY